MNIENIKGRLAFLQEAERLKRVLRSAHTSTGRTESTAEHTWRLCLMAMAVKALDKMETILQHNQGINPPDFDYGFNLTYGQKHTSADPLFALVRSLLDEDTRRRIAASNNSPGKPS